VKIYFLTDVICVELERLILSLMKSQWMTISH